MRAMKKLNLFNLLTMLISLISVNAYAHDIEVQNGGKTIYYNIISNTKLEVTFRGESFNTYDKEYSGEIVIPASVTYQGITYSVTSISKEAFYNCSGMTSLTIPNSVIFIGDEAFRNCWGLTSLIIPNSVTSIDKEAFAGCSGLTSVTIPNSVTTISARAFTGCSSLTSVTIPNSMTSISVGAFYGCSGLTSITIPNSVTSIEASAFNGCYGLTSVTIPNSVTSIGVNVFQGCTSLTSITIPNSVTYIAQSTFNGCSSLTSVTIPNSVTLIDYNAFLDCSSLTSVTIPNSVISFGKDAFYNCTSLTSVTVESKNPSRLYTADVFSNRKNATLYVPVGSKATYEAADGWKEFKEIIEMENSPVAEYTDEQGVKYSLNDDESTYSVSGYTDACTGDIVIPSSVNGCSVTSIGNSAFMNCYALSTITIPNSVTSIGQNAFSDCTSLALVNMEVETPIVITADVFTNADRVNAALHVPAGCKAAYADASIWKEFGTILEGNEGTIINTSTIEGWNVVFTTLDDTKKTCQVGYLDGSFNKPAVDRDAVDGSLTIPESVDGYKVVKIGKYAFDNTIKMTSVTIPATVTYIDRNAFFNCNGLTSFELPAGVAHLGDRALSSLRGVTSLKVADGNTFYDSHGDCNAIIETATNKLLFGSKITTIPADVPEIGESAFENMDNFTFTIPSTVTKIDDNAFYFCSNWTLQVENATPLQISENVFGDMSNSTTLRVPLGSKDAYTEATGWNNFGTIEEDITFIAKTTEGIDVVFSVLDETAKTCRVGYIDGSSDKTAVTDGSSLAGTLTIPSSVTPPGGSDSYTVKEIGKYAFYDCSTLESIVIPNSIEVIDNYALAGCGELGSITLPAQLTTIGDKAFMDCKTIESINIPASVSSIGKGILSGCIGLSFITVTNGNTRYYSGMDNNVIICEAYTVIAGCKNTVIPSSITKIDDYAFENLDDVSIVIPNTVTEIGVSSFAGLSNSVVTLPTTAVTIGDHAFADGDNSMIISSYQTPITTVHADAFIYSSSSPTPKKLQVPAGTKDEYLAATGWNVFGSDNIIEEQAGVKTINVANAGTLSGLISAAEKYSITELKLTGELNGTDFRLIREMAGNDYQGNPTGGKLKILDISEANIVEGGEKYIDTDKVTSSTGTITVRGGDFFHFNTQNNVLGNSLFAGCDKLEKVILPESLTSIGDYVFWYCLNLKAFEVPKNVTSIGEDFIYGPHKITEISVEEGNTVFSMVGDKKGLMLGTKLLLGCSDTEIPASTTIIGANAFAYCDGLTTVTVPANVTTIERDAFLLSGLTSINLPGKLTTIEGSAFAGCSGLKSLTIPKSVTSFSPTALMNCSQLTELIVEDGNTIYDSRDNCNAIIEKATNKLICGSMATVIPSTVKVIGDDAFRESQQLSSFTIPDWVTTIGERAFMYGGLETITIPSSVTTIGENAFTGCNRLTTVTVESTTPPSINNSFNTYERLTLYVPAGCIATYQAIDGWKDFSKIEEIPTSTVLTARSFSRKYGKENPVFDYIVEGKAITGTPEITCAATTSSDVGTYEIVISKGSVTNSNVTYVNGTLTIEKAMGDMSAPSGKGDIIYSGTAQELVTAGRSTTGTMEYSLDGTNYGTAIPKGTEAKDYMIYYRVKGDNNHEDVAAESFKVTIRKAPLKITAKSYTRKQGEANPEFDVTYDGLKNSETSAVLTTKPTVTCAATKDSPAGTYDITVSGAVAGNYEISYVAGTLTVEAVTPPTPMPEPKGTIFDLDTDDSSSKEVKITFVVKESDGSDTPTVAISDDKDASGSVSIPESVTHNGVEYKVTEISEGAFQNNTSLTEVKIPASITSIGPKAFAGCKNLQEITINIIVPINLSIISARGYTRAESGDVFEGVNKETCILYVPEGSVDAYKAAAGWKEFKNILPIKTSTRIYGIESDGEVFDVYSLSGQKVKSKTTSLDGLPRGIYIINGKKVMK